jgi:hypothetical protein
MTWCLRRLLDGHAQGARAGRVLASADPGGRVLFDSPGKLEKEAARLLEIIRGLAEGRYACVLEPDKTVLESVASDSWEIESLRRLVERQRTALFTLPASLADQSPMEDIFAEWTQDEFLIAFVNGRVAMLVACPDAELAKRRSGRPLRTLVGRLLRLNPTYRLDAKGRGLFFGNPRLDLVVVGGADESS